jgi:hypothetical protein
MPKPKLPADDEIIEEIEETDKIEGTSAPIHAHRV